MQLQPAIQEALVALLCFDGETAPVAASVVPAQQYDAYYQEIVEAVTRYRLKYGKVPGEHTLDVVANLKKRWPKNADIYQRIYESLEMTKVGLNAEYVLAQASLFARHQRLKVGLSRAIDSLQAEDETGITEAEGVLRKALDSSIELFDPGTRLKDTARSLAFLDSEEDEFFPTGIRALDGADLGPIRKGLHLFIAPKKAGKSWWLINLAKRALLDRKRVLYITLEMKEKQVLQRLYQALFSFSKRKELVKSTRFELDEFGRFASFTQRDLDRPAMTDPNIRKRLTRLAKTHLAQRPDIYVRQFPTGMLTTEELEGYLASMEARGFLPDLLILDYADLMHVPVNDYRLQLGALYRNLRGIAVKKNIAIATASQSNRAGALSKLATGENVAEDYSKLATCDVALTYNQTQAEHELGLARIYVAAARADKDKFTILISQAYQLGQFVLDEAGLVSSYWESLGAENESRSGPSGEGDDQAVRSDEGSNASRSAARKRGGPKGRARRERL